MNSINDYKAEAMFHIASVFILPRIGFHIKSNHIIYYKNN